MRPKTTRTSTGARTALALCAAVFVAGLVELIVPGRPAYAGSFAPPWLALVAAAIAAAGIGVRLRDPERRSRTAGALSWSGLLLLLSTASGLPLDLLRAASLVVPGLMPPGIDWPGLATRALALAAVVVLGRRVLSYPASAPRARTALLCGMAALALALPYPLLKTWWALGGSFGLRWPGADGLADSFGLWLPAVPWLLDAVLSLGLALAPRWMPRRLLLVAGWSATVVAASFGPAACWALVHGLADGTADLGGMHAWVYGLVYGSWLLWAIVAAAATRAYQLRTAGAAAYPVAGENQAHAAV